MGFMAKELPVLYVTRSRDGVIRRVCVKYFNHKENKPRFTDSTVRSLVKLFTIDDSYFMHDMAKAEKLMEIQGKEEMPEKDGAYKTKGAIATACNSCCHGHGHCKLSAHMVGGALRGVSLDDDRREVGVCSPNGYERDFLESTEAFDYESKQVY